MRLLPFNKYVGDPEHLKQLPLLPVARRLIWQSSISPIGQFSFIPDDIEVLALYVREKPALEFQENCLFNDQGQLLSKGRHYFKEYSKRYASGAFRDFTHLLIGLLSKVAQIPFEEEDLTLRLKVLGVLSEELLNHLAWGLYLALYAGGLRRDCLAPVTPNEISALQAALLVGAQLWVQTFLNSSPAYESMSHEIEHHLASCSLKFIGVLATHEKRNEIFFRLRGGCHELQNLIHALLLRNWLAGEKLVLDGVVAPFYGGLTSAAVAHAVLTQTSHPLSFKIVVHSPYSDHFQRGELVGIERRRLHERIAQIPPLVRPFQPSGGSKWLVLDDAVVSGTTLIGIRDYLKLYAPHSLYLSAVSAPVSLQLSDGCLTTPHGVLKFAYPPTFEQPSIAVLRHCQKRVGRR